MLMIGVSTGQNIANVIPAVQKELEITEFLAIETSIARNSGWFDGSQKVLEGRNIRTDKLDISPEDTHIVEIKNKLKEKIKNHSEPIIWNLGGGQKPQQMPVWELFYERNQRGIKDRVCYANQTPASELEFWYFDEQKRLQRTNSIIEVDLTAEEIFRIFGFVVKDDPELIYKKNQNVLFNETRDLLKYQEFRQFLFELAKNFTYQKDSQTPFTLDEISLILKSKSNEIESLISKRLSESTCKFFNTENQRKALTESLRAFLFGKTDTKGKLIEWLEQPMQTRVLDTSEDLKKELGLDLPQIDITSETLRSITNYRKSAFYFEKIVAQRVREMLLKENHSIVEAFANLKIARTIDSGKVAAEYDVLCVTNKGTIIALDAKTFEFASKDIDARLFNLQEGSGFYRKFSVVIPLDYDDVDAGFIPPEITNLAFDLKKKKLDFFVVSNHPANEKSFWIKKSNTQIEKSVTEQPGSDWLECQPLIKAFT